MADVKMLIIGTARGNWKKGKKGDTWEVVSSQQDWGNATVSPDWLRLTITDVPGTQAEAEQAIRDAYLQPYSTGFLYIEVAGAGAGEQRYRVEVRPELDTVTTPLFNAIRDGITSRFATTGTHVNQSNRRWFEFDAFPGLPLDEVEQQLDESAEGARRFQLDANLVDNAIGSVAAGEPATLSITNASAQTNIQDKLA